MSSDLTEPIEIANAGLKVSVLRVGASLLRLDVKCGERFRAVILRYNSLNTYKENSHYLGAIVGRCANRIRDGHCEIDGKTYQLDLNEASRTHLHGGSGGLSRKRWSIESHSASAVVLSVRSPHGDQGYPGNLEATCKYELVSDTCVRMTLQAICDRDTLVNLSTHGYFNLEPESSILDHMLQINASHYTPVDADLIPDGRIENVEGTCFDFRLPRRIGNLRHLSPLGYDHNFVLASAPRAEPVLAATLTSPAGDLAMDILTTEPGLQFYDGQKLAPDEETGELGLSPFAAGCFEPQRHPDSVHHPGFAQSLLRAGERYLQTTEYHFRTAT